MSIKLMQNLAKAKARPMLKFFLKHELCEGFNPALEYKARKEAGIGNTYYCCYTCGERVIREIKIEKVGK